MPNSSRWASHILTLSSLVLLLAHPGFTHAQKLTLSAPAKELKPVNLKVLANQHLTMRQVREIMEDWTDEIGGDCSTCHVRNTKLLISAGAPRYNYADDSKQEKKTARVMYSMTQSINERYLATVPNSGIPVTCGTCHRGHLSPELFSAPDATPKGPGPGTRAH